ncbi:hypothetical protein HK097_005237 [Rhizophlyctis rosea]|uniref:Uncharacterized protein n=1 Tax=Rhizophlyctis rosea TaxID=64517 RepID=A0AAD5SF73_9FUNG|nr:hypothetical protein HK097_005237 [Rhizophlyctis rosea]
MDKQQEALQDSQGTSHLYPTLDDVPPPVYQSPPSYGVVNSYSYNKPLPTPPTVIATPPSQPSTTPAPPPSTTPQPSPTTLTLLNTTCTLHAPHTKKPSPIGIGPLTLTSHPKTHILTLSIADWEFHIPQSSSRVEAAAAAESGQKQFDVSVPGTARVVRKAGGVAGKPVGVSGKMRIVVGEGTSGEDVRLFERILGV